MAEERIIGKKLLHYSSLPSTMEVAAGEARRGGEEGTVVWADEQLSGRGRKGRGWVSPRGGLFLSIVLRPTLPQLPSLLMLASVALVRVLGRLFGLTARLKWPNDVLIKGKKVSGVLVETSFRGEVLEYAIIGIGLNVNMDPERYPEISATATSLSRELGREVDLGQALEAFLEELDGLYGGLRLGRGVFEEWKGYLETLGQRVKVIGVGVEEEGVAQDVAPDGRLLLLRKDGQRVEVPAGEVSMFLWS